MYEMGLLTKPRTKSANIVGQTMKLNPHGDAAIYETMVRLACGNETLLHPFVDSKGNFGKVYSRDMAYAASRYTEAKLEPICAELCSAISTPIPSILSTITTAPCRSLCCCRQRSRTCWSRPTWASLSAWRRISARSIWPRSAARRSRSSKTRTRTCSTRSRPRISRRAAKFSTIRPRCCRFMRRAAARSACGQNGAMSRKGT